jgi:hypothetical protein
MCKKMSAILPPSPKDCGPDPTLIPAQSIFAVEPGAWSRWKGILIENIIIIKNNNNNFIFYLRSLKMEFLKKVFLIFFKVSKLVDDYHLLLPSKPLEGYFCSL